ncbi:mono-ADP-ribosyltransferase sirtuin 6 [Galdieria sulphuraria]|uniref:protein acetyllysine N-acetyltransferase n=1 Tax=Galdieria sulphuraria TaxID=130081 RepID=M2Y3Q5_GALSU|nr:mono-ADP-ribosyltransferase sirtuin 6 [Galdieria sulphuraria]EME30603.1 mono-ADP-ribosyltransferase sirtuin 6 [Galdieria sulphuraria]|eukprot:XP_005707123.1 mono-ADP-ribosyltransferase sirtuin 6 [Galdieria sulphuraria]
MVNVASNEYAYLLSPCEAKGKLDLKEEEESRVSLSLKLRKLVEFIRQSDHVVVHTGAGVSTKAGIADFRGPRGFRDALPTITHFGIAQLCKEKLVRFVVTQNVDGLHRKSGVPEHLLAEIHGCLFVGYCTKCERKQVLDKPTHSVGFRDIQIPCSRCSYSLCDFVLDWYDELPKVDLEKAIFHSRKADLHIVIGSSLQMLPSKNFCLMSVKTGARLVILNLSETSHDSKATMILRGDSDRCISAILFLLQLPVALFVPKQAVQVNATVNDKDKSEMETCDWQLKVDCNTFPRHPCRIQPKQVETHSLYSFMDWTWNEENGLLTIWISSIVVPTVSITFCIFFPNLPCCCFTVQHSFSKNAFKNYGSSEWFQLSSISSVTDVVEGFHLAYETLDQKIIQQNFVYYVKR